MTARVCSISRYLLRFSASLLILGWMLLIGGGTALAEGKKKTAAPGAWLRIWAGDFPSGQSIRATVRTSGRKSSTSDRVENLGKYRFGDYAAAPVGNVTIEIADEKDEKNPLAIVPAHLAADSFWTLLVRETGGEIRAELIDDTPAGAKTVALTVRNFAPTLSTLEIEAGPDFHAKLSSPESFVHVLGLPQERLQVETSGSESSGNVLQWTNSVDFTKFRGATVLIYPDPYGRIRPRVVIDGQIIAVPVEGAPESSPASK